MSSQCSNALVVTRGWLQKTACVPPRTRVSRALGSAAMRHLAESDALRPIGCTQSTEIISTPGVVLSGSLPRECELSTVYTAAVTTHAANARQAKDLIDLLIGSDQDKLRERAGFLNARK